MTTDTHRELDYCDPFEALPSLGKVTTNEFEDLLGFAGRCNGPALLFDAWWGGHIGRDTVTAVIGHVWSCAEYPDQNLDCASWRGFFRLAGFTVDGKPAERPTEPLTLWRGSVPERRRDWSWTTDRQVAEKFAAGVRGRKPGRLYRVVAPPKALLCANNEREEAEYVVDTKGLRIREQLA